MPTFRDNRKLVNIKLNLPICLELSQWRDEEIKQGHMDKAKKIQAVINKYWPW